jgi:hypothetical protein
MSESPYLSDKWGWQQGFCRNQIKTFVTLNPRSNSVRQVILLLLHRGSVSSSGSRTFHIRVQCLWPWCCKGEVRDLCTWHCHGHPSFPNLCNTSQMLAICQHLSCVISLSLALLYEIQALLFFLSYRLNHSALHVPEILKLFPPSLERGSISVTCEPGSHLGLFAELLATQRPIHHKSHGWIKFRVHYDQPSVAL